MTDTQYRPNPALKSLARLVGSWQISGPNIEGTTTYKWLENSFFLLQTFDFIHNGHEVKGLEVIGFERAFGAELSADIKSRIYDNQGNTFDYVYELTGDTLTIWAGEKGSPAYYRGTFSEDGTICMGAWVYPGGGGYDSTMKRVGNA